MTKKPIFSKKILESIQRDYGVENLYIDTAGNICDCLTHQIIAPARSLEEVQVEEKADCREYFRSLPTAVQNELLKVALAHMVQHAMQEMREYSPSKKDGELWCLSYEELAKIVAEKVLLDE